MTPSMRDEHSMLLLQLRTKGEIVSDQGARNGLATGAQA